MPQWIIGTGASFVRLFLCITLKGVKGLMYGRMGKISNKENAYIHSMYRSANNDSRGKATVCGCIGSCLKQDHFLFRADAGRARTARKAVVEEGILDMLGDQPSTSARAVARILSLSHSTTWWVLDDEILHLYRVESVQSLTVEGYSRRVDIEFWVI